MVGGGEEEEEHVWIYFYDKEGKTKNIYVILMFFYGCVFSGFCFISLL